MLHRPTIGPLTGSSRTMPWVELNQNEAFNMKFVIDAQQPWTRATSWGWYKQPDDILAYGSIEGPTYSGVPMRVYFEKVEEEGPDEGTVTDPTEVYKDVIPYLNVPFSAENEAEATYTMTDMDVRGNYNVEHGNANYYPQFMKIWG